MQLARERNAVAHQHGFEVPYPEISELQPDTGARFVHEYFEQEIKRRKKEPVPEPPTFEAPHIDRYYQPWEPAPDPLSLSLFAPMPEGVIDFKRQKHNNPCPLGGPCCALRTQGSCVQDGRHVKHRHMSECPKGRGNEARRRAKAAGRAV
jgi:hypothetical protein